MFSGLGFFREGLTRAGGFECVGHCEIDPYADRSYRALFDCEGEWFCKDAKAIRPEEMPDFDLLIGGFPCQSFSISGARNGFDDPRGTLFFELARVVEAKKPAYLFLENVPGLLSHDHGETYLTILRTLSGLGYICEWQTLYSSDFGIPQGRKRLYLIGYRDKRCAGKVFPLTESYGSALVPSAERGQQNLGAALKIKGDTKTGFVEAFPGDSVSLGFLCNEKKHGRVKRGQAHTLTTRNNEAVVTEDGRIRRLMPQEYLRLQGLHKDQIAKVMAVNSESQIYKQAGNGVTIPVIEAIGRRICEMDQDRRCGNH